MLDRVPEFAPNALRVQGDLEHLPFRPQSLATAWARNSYVHLPRTSIPLAFAELQRSLRVGARFTIRLFLGENEGYDTFPDSEFGGRYFSFWCLDELIGDVQRDRVHEITLVENEIAGVRFVGQS